MHARVRPRRSFAHTCIQPRLPIQQSTTSKQPTAVRESSHVGLWRRGVANALLGSIFVTNVCSCQGLSGRYSILGVTDVNVLYSPLFCSHLYRSWICQWMYAAGSAR